MSGKSDWGAVIDAYAEYLGGERGFSRSTIRSYRSDLDDFGHFLHRRRVMGIEGVSRRLVRSYIAELHRRDLSTRTISRRLSALRGVFRWLEFRGEVAHDPTSGLSGPAIHRALPEYLKEEEVTELLEAPDPAEPRGARDRAILELLYGAGLRVGELVGLDNGSVDLGARSLRVMGKGSRERRVPVGESAADALRRYLARRPHLVTRTRAARLPLLDRAASPLFINRWGTRLSDRSVRRIVASYARTSVPGGRCYPHELRHTFATHMVARGAELHAVRALMGHASLSTTQVYTHVSPERLRSAVERAHPRG